MTWAYVLLAAVCMVAILLLGNVTSPLTIALMVAGVCAVRMAVKSSDKEAPRRLHKAITGRDLPREPTER